MIMNKKTYHSLRTLFAAGALLLTAACSNDETDDFYAAHPDAVRFGVTIGATPATRVNTDGDGTTFSAGDRIGISADGGTSYTTYELPSEGSEWTPADGARYLKWKEQTLSFKAYYPVTEGTSYSYFEMPIDQSELELLRKADYMLAEATDQTAGAAVPLTFKHQLAKVTVILTPGDEAEGETVSRVDVSIRGNVIENGIVTNKNTTSANVYSYKKDANTFIAIVPPQEAAPDKKFIKVFTGNSPYYKEYTLTGIPKLDKGKAYTLNLQVGHDGVKLGGITVEEWNTQEMSEGEAVYQDPTVWNGIDYSQPAGYTAGTPGEVNINTAAELAWLAQLPQQYNDLTGYTFKLTADIDLNNHEWTPIGQRLYGFKGTFDGQGHTVRNLKCTSKISAGLFSRITTATVKNVTVSGTISYNTNNASFSCYLGGIAGEVNNSTITNCINQCTISATGSNDCYVGGIAGYAVNEYAYDNSMTFSGNTNTGNLSTSEHADSRVGGIIGVAQATLENRSITLTRNSYDAGTPANICIGRCIFSDGGSITVDNASATHNKPYPNTEP